MEDDPSFATNWFEQMEEIVALRSILGPDFRFMTCAGSPELADDADLTELLQQSPPDPPQTLCCQVAVKVEVPEEGLTFSVVSASGSQSSSKDAQDAATVFYLPTVCLRLELGPAYPSHAPPKFSLSAFWLSRRQLTEAALALDRIWELQPYAPVCFSWVDWLQRSLLEALQIGMHASLDVQPLSLHSCDLSRIGLCSNERPPEQILRALVQHDKLHSDAEFRKGIWSCPICLEEQVGEKFVRLDDCRHFCCVDCFQQYCAVNIQQGTVELHCPEVKCDTPLPPHLLKAHISQEDFDRWESLLLSRTLDMMTDIQYCPRCSTASVVESDHFAQCPKCLYAFCTQCTDAYHPGRCLTLSSLQLEGLVFSRECQRIEDKILEAEGKASKMEQLRQLQDLENQVKSLKLLEETTQKCPCCGMGIEKTGGCNHMFCTYCEMHYCHICRALNITYDHFRAHTCALFDASALEEWEREMNPDAFPEPQEEAPNVGRPVAIEVLNRVQRRCPVCHVPQVKMDRDNLIRCYVCSSRFCFLCQAALPKKNPQQHFGRDRCRQHS